MSRSRLLIGLMAASALLFTACGDDGDAATGDTSADAGGDAAGGPVTVDIVDFEYDPPTITVAAGTEITFTNSDGAAHTATARDGEFNTESIAGGEQATVTAEGSGEVAYFCSFHPFMEATVVIE